MELFSIKTGLMYADGKELNDFAFYEKHRKRHIRSWFRYFFCCLFNHTFSHDPDICDRCELFIG